MIKWKKKKRTEPKTHQKGDFVLVVLDGKVSHRRYSFKYESGASKVELTEKGQLEYLKMTFQKGGVRAGQHPDWMPHQVFAYICPANKWEVKDALQVWSNENLFWEANDPAKYAEKFRSKRDARSHWRMWVLLKNEDKRPPIYPQSGEEFTSWFEGFANHPAMFSDGRHIFQNFIAENGEWPTSFLQLRNLIYQLRQFPTAQKVYFYNQSDKSKTPTFKWDFRSKQLQTYSGCQISPSMFFPKTAA